MDSDCDTEHQVRAGGGAGGGATRPTAGERQHWSTAGDKVDIGYPHLECIRV